MAEANPASDVLPPNTSEAIAAAANAKAAMKRGSTRDGQSSLLSTRPVGVDTPTVSGVSNSEDAPDISNTERSEMVHANLPSGPKNPRHNCTTHGQGRHSHVDATSPIAARRRRRSSNATATAAAAVGDKNDTASAAPPGGNASAATVISTPVERSSRWRFVASRRPRHRNMPEVAMLHPRPRSSSTTGGTDGGDGEGDAEERRSDRDYDADDPFDCSDLAAPRTHDRVDRAIEVAARRWRDLDSRRIPAAVADLCDDGDNDDHQNVGPASATSALGLDEKGGGRLGSVKRQRLVSFRGTGEDDKGSDDLPSRPRPAGRHAYGRKPHFTLPEDFDYQCRRGGPPSQEEISASKYPRDKVLSLTSAEALDYETELWKIFNSVPTIEDLLADEEHQDSTIEDAAPCRHTLRLRREVEECINQSRSRVDGHALSRVRMKDLHHFPPADDIHWRGDGWRARMSEEARGALLRLGAGESGDGDGSDVGGGGDVSSEPCNDVVVRVECWRRHPKKGSSSDENRLEMEFRGSATLLDVHACIVENTRDSMNRFFVAATEGDGNCRSAEGIGAADDDGNAKAKKRINRESPCPRCPNSGLFFVENTFYTAGPVDYSAPIVEWLRDGVAGSTAAVAVGAGPVRASALSTSRPSSSTTDGIVFPRDDLLRITMDRVRVRTMMETRLENLPFRLGVRYLHMCNGDLECAVFFTDVRQIQGKMQTREPRVSESSRRRQQQWQRGPVILDAWSSKIPSTTPCTACSHRVAVVACFDDRLTAGVGGPTNMCTECYRDCYYFSPSRGSGTGGECSKLRYNNFRAYPLDFLTQRPFSAGNEPMDAKFLAPLPRGNPD